MTRVFHGARFDGFDDRDSSAVFVDLEFRRCEFVGCGVSITDDPARRSTARSIAFVDCLVDESCGIWPIVCENILIDKLRTRGLLQLWAAAFKHVTLRGRIGRIMLSPTHPRRLIKKESEALQQLWDEANAAFYKDVDWALDISGAEFADVPDIRAIPARLIRRDPETQVVVTRERALSGRHRQLEFPDSLRLWAGMIDLLLEGEEPDMVLAAPKRSREFKELLYGLEMLRKAGLTESD